MKKTLHTFLLILLLITSILLCGCSRIDEEIVKQIYFSGMSGDNFSDLYREKPYFPTVGRDDTAKSTLVITINGCERILTYKETLWFEMDGAVYSIIHRYSVDGDEKCMVNYRQDGSLEGIYGQLASIPLSENASSEDVIALLKQVLLPYVDVSGYQQIRVQENESSYTVFYYDQVDSYVTEEVSVSVARDGSVRNLKIGKASREITVLSVDEALVDDYLEMTLRGALTTDKCEFLAYEYTDSTRHLDEINGKAYLVIPIGVHYQYQKREYCYALTAYVPLDLVTESK